MNAAAASVGVLAWALLFVTGFAGSFDVNDIYPAYAKLSDRQCLPENFGDTSPSDNFSACEALVTGSQLPDECQPAPALALFYNCYAAVRGLIDEGPAPADEDILEEVIESIYNGIKANLMILTLRRAIDERWLKHSYQIVDDCEAHAAAGLTPRQTAVFAFLCLRWKAFADCDHDKEENGTLDAIGARRRVDFIWDGECPLSPRRPEMFAVLTSVGGRTLEECGQGLYDGQDALEKYADTVPRVICMLQKFQTDDNLNYVQLENAIADELAGANSEAAELLLHVVHACEHSEMSVDFVKCWADFGISDCIYHQANEVAAEFPDECHLSPSIE